MTQSTQIRRIRGETHSGAAEARTDDESAPDRKQCRAVSDRPAAHVIGLISDTHGVVRPDVHRALAGVELILHAGDVGGDEVLDELALIAPVRAVYGNTDPPGDPRLAETIVHSVGGVLVRVTHGHELGSPTPLKLLQRYAEGVVVYGHTHRELVTRAGGRLLVNPGAAGPRRFDVRPTVARLTIDGGQASVEVVPLAD